MAPPPAPAAPTIEAPPATPPQPEAAPAQPSKTPEGPTPAAVATAKRIDENQQAGKPAREILEEVAAKTPTPVSGENPEAQQSPESAQEGPQLEEVSPPTKEAPSPKEPQPVQQSKEIGPSKEAVNTALETAGKLLLEMRDPRVLTVALARNVGTTDIAIEFRRDVLHMIQTLKPEQIPEPQRAPLAELQTQLQTMNMEPTKPEESAFLRFLSEQQSAHPQIITDEVLEAIKTNKIDQTQTIASLLQANTEIGGALWEKLKGDQEQIPHLVNPERLLQALYIDPTSTKPEQQEAIKGAHALFTDKRLSRTQSNVAAMAMPALMLGATLLALSSSAFSDEGGGQTSGHH